MGVARTDLAVWLADKDQASFDEVVRSFGNVFGPESLQPHTRLSELDAIQKWLLWRICEYGTSHVPPELAASVGSVGDLVDWASVRGGSSPGSPPPLAQPWSTSRVRLRPLLADDVAALYEASVEPTLNYRWRFRGSTPSIGAFQQVLFQDVLAQFIVQRHDEAEPTGLVTSYNFKPEAGHVYIGFQRTSRNVEPSGEMLDGVFLLIEYLFANWPIRKVYAELPDYNFYPLGSLGRIGTVEGCFKAHLVRGEQVSDLFTIAIYREAWASFAGLVRPLLGGAE